MKRKFSFFNVRVVLLSILLPAIVMTSTAYADVVIDNGDPGTSYTGTWSPSSGAGYYGTNSLFARPSATYTWSFNSQQPGTYEVLVWWTSVNTRGSDVEITVNGSETHTTFINQIENGSQWNSLGTFSFDTDGSVTITASDELLPDGRTVSTCADAIWFRYVDESEVIIDNGDPDTFSTGNWPISGGALSYGTTSVYARPDASYTWQFNSSHPAGIYEISMWWTVVSTRGDDIEVQIDSGSTIETVSIDQTANGGRWNSLGNFSLDENSGSVTIIASDATLANGTTVSTSADAVRYVLVSSTTYSIESTAGENGTISPSGNVTVIESYDQDFTITPNAGYQIADVLVDGSSVGAVSAYTFSNVTSDHTIEALFGVVPSYTITASSGANGTINPSGNVSVTEGEDQVFSIVADSGYRVADVKVDGSSVGAVASYTFNSVFGNSTIEASFEAVPSHVITASAGENGAITPSGPVTVSEGEDQVFSISADSGYRVADVLVNGTSVGAVTSYTFNSVYSNSSIEAYFEVVPTYTITASAGANGAISPSGDVLVTEGEEQVFDIVADSGYQIADVQVDGTSVGAVDNYTFSGVGENHGIAAFFEEVVMPTEYIIDNGGSGTSSTGTWRASSGANSYGSASVYARPSATYTWQAEFQPGYYEVMMWWTVVSTRGSSIPVDVSASDGAHSVTVDQTTNGGQWNSIGTYRFDSNGSVTVTASEDVLPGGQTVSTCADAVRFVYVGPANIPPIAKFSAETTMGAAPFEVQFIDSSAGEVSEWLWDFGDGQTSADQNPTHIFEDIGDYTVSLTVTNNYGSDTVVESSYIQALNDIENIYVAHGFGTGYNVWAMVGDALSGMGAVYNNGVWVYENSSKGITYFVHFVDNIQDFDLALKEENSHVIFTGHSNYGTGFFFGDQQESVTYLDDDLFYNVSSDMATPDIGGLQFGNGYPNLQPLLQDGTSPIMPYDFNDPAGLPPYNYYITYQIPGDDTYYLVERSDGGFIERFPGCGVPAWYSPEGLPPDPDLNPEYFIVNPSPYYNHFATVGDWASASPGDWHEDQLYMGQDYIYHGPGVGANTATWYLAVDTPGYYAVIATWYPDSSYASNAPYTIHFTGGEETVRVDQRTSEMYNMLGVYYFEPGEHTVVLTDDADGTVAADVVMLQHVSGPSVVLQAEFDAFETMGSAPLTVAFTDFSIAPSETEIVGWSWDFGDGSVSSEQNPSHTYSDTGSYTVTLTITDSLGNQTSETKENLINVDYVSLPAAEFTAEERVSISGGMGSLDGTVEVDIQFIDQSAGEITNWNWDFGDGSTSNEQNPVHHYSTVGAHTVTLTVSGPDGSDVETETAFVVVTAGMIGVDDLWTLKPHFYRDYAGFKLGATVMDMSGVTADEDEFRYSRIYIHSCNSDLYYLDKFQRGPTFYTNYSSGGPLPIPTYLRLYLQGASDQEILEAINRVNDIHDYHNFDLPPSDQ
jgi:PKD repeat protein